MKYFIPVILFISIIVPGWLISCDPAWEDHYKKEDQVDMSLWEAIRQEPRYSSFVSVIESTGLDTIFEQGMFFTLFIPPNEAFDTLSETAGVIESILKYHISQTIFIDRNVNDLRRLQTILGKFVLIEAYEDVYFFDGIPMEYSSPLYSDGKYYEIARVALPKPNLYEFTARTSTILREYIDSKDSVYLDRSLSTPIGFDEEGNTIYDSVFAMVNLFEETYFPVTEEFRNKSATFIIMSQEQYDLALDDMAARLGGNLTDHNDIPVVWQNNVLLPEIIKNAMFDGDLSYDDLTVGKLQSITGDTVTVEYQKIDPESRTICSNGVAFLYSEYSVNDSLFRGTVQREGEELIDSVGLSKFVWKKGVIASGAMIEPEKSYAEVASGGATVTVPLGRNFNGIYTLQFTFKDLFPMRYRLEWRANSRPSGIFRVYLNDQLLEYQDKFGNILTEFDTYDLRNSIISVTGERFLAEGGFNKKDYWIENLTEYGDVKVKFEYAGIGGNSTNGLNIDYVKLIPDY